MISSIQKVPQSNFRSLPLGTSQKLKSSTSSSIFRDGSTTHPELISKETHTQANGKGQLNFSGWFAILKSLLGITNSEIRVAGAV
ncbi:MAG: hypothetical protein SFU25_11330 [Candidatus Caenarcaniphilales bacterium]|nr:hypothetical protein [Candidatus Caenarcaniphilales bacterium]